MLPTYLCLINKISKSQIKFFACCPDSTVFYFILNSHVTTDTFDNNKIIQYATEFLTEQEEANRNQGKNIFKNIPGLATANDEYNRKHYIKNSRFRFYFENENEKGSGLPKLKSVRDEISIRGLIFFIDFNGFREISKLKLWTEQRMKEMNRNE